MIEISKLFALLTLILLLVKPQDATRNFTEIVDKLLRNYDPQVSPSRYQYSLGNNLNATSVQISMFVTDISISDQNLMWVQMYFRQKWHDERLRYEADIKDLTLDNPKLIWTPDTFFANAITEAAHEITRSNIFLRLQPDGTVFISCRYSLSFRCPMSFRYFPFDKHQCPIEMESYGASSEEIKYEWKPHGIGIDEASLSLKNFVITNSSMSEKLLQLSSGSYSRALATFSLTRNTKNLWTIFVPYGLLALLSWASLWIAPSMRWFRLGFNAFIFFILWTSSLSLSNHLPDVSYVTLQELWIRMSMCISLLAVIESLLVAFTSQSKCKRSSNLPDSNGLQELLVKKVSDCETPPTSMHVPTTAQGAIFKIFNPYVLDTFCKIFFPCLFGISLIIFFAA